MDGRDSMTLSGGSHPYYIHRSGVGGSGSLSQPTPLQTPPPYRTLSNPSLTPQPSARPTSSGPFSIETSNSSYGHAVDIPTSVGVAASEPVKRKRGRPRKYAPDGQMSLGLSPLPAKPKPSSATDPLVPKRARGRPPGTGRKQRLATLGDWMNNSAGLAFAPHVIKIGVGEDIVSKILSFSQQRPRAVCVLTGTGSVSSVTLRQPASAAPAVTYEGRFEILCLSGSYLVAEDGGPRSRTGGVSASLSSPDGLVIGGALAVLIAATPVQVILCSFVYGSSKTKDKPIGRPKKDSVLDTEEKPSSPSSAVPIQGFSSPVSVWSGGSRPVEARNPHSDIDLTKG